MIRVPQRNLIKSNKIESSKGSLRFEGHFRLTLHFCSQKARKPQTPLNNSESIARSKVTQLYYAVHNGNNGMSVWLVLVSLTSQLYTNCSGISLV